MKPLRYLYFATSSDVKFNHYRVIFSDLGFDFRKGPIITHLIEPQLNDSDSDGYDLLVAHPLRLAARFLSRKGLLPYVIEDTLLVISAFSNPKNPKYGLPGADTKNWWTNLGIDGVLKMLQSSKDRSAFFVSVIGSYVGGNEYLFSSHRVDGSIAHERRISDVCMSQVPETNPFFFHSVFIPRGAGKTYAEMEREEFKEYDYRRINAMKFSHQLSEFNWATSSQLELGL